MLSLLQGQRSLFSCILFFVPAMCFSWIFPFFVLPYFPLFQLHCCAESGTCSGWLPQELESDFFLPVRKDVFEYLLFIFYFSFIKALQLSSIFFLFFYFFMFIFLIISLFLISSIWMILYDFILTDWGYVRKYGDCGHCIWNLLKRKQCQSRDDLQSKRL